MPVTYHPDVPDIGDLDPAWSNGIRGVLRDLTARGTFDEMQAIAAPNIGARFVCEDQFDAEYVYSPGFARWRLASLYPGQYAPIEYGADPFGILDSRAAILAALADASTSMGTQPLAGDGEIYGEIVWTTGVFLSSAAIDLPQDRPLRMSAHGGGNIIGGTFSWQTSPVIVFTAGGFRLQTNQANAVSWDGIGVVGAPALFVDRGSGPGHIQNCSFRSTVAGVPAVQIRNSFWGFFFNCGFEAPDTATPSVLVESSTAFTPGIEGWCFRWLTCRFNKAGVRWDCTGPTLTVVGLGTLFDSCDMENFAAGGALMHVRNVDPTQAFTFYDVTMRSCSIFDPTGAVDYVRVETLGAGALIVSSISLTNCVIAGGGHQHVHFVNSGSVDPTANAIKVEGQAPVITFAGAHGVVATGMTGGWDARGDRASAIVLRGRVAGDAADRFRHAADGSSLRGLGAATPDVYFGPGSGSPEGVVTSAPSGVYQDLTNGIVYVKVTGTGNTGWKAIAGVSNDKVAQNVAGTSFIDWSRTQFRFIGNGTAITGEVRQNATSQTVDLLNIATSAGVPLSHFNKDGYFMTRKVAAPADAAVATSELAIWLDDTPGATKAMFKAKDSGGTVRTAAVALA